MGAASTSSPRRRAVQLVSELRRQGSQRNRDGMARFAIPSERAFGVSMAVMQRLAKREGRNHALALELWKTNWHEPRCLAVFVAEPERMTPAQMDAWCRDFDNWAICDTACFHLFDRSPHAFAKVRAWAGKRAEFEKRASFALMASVALHNKAAPDSKCRPWLRMIERASTDERNFVKKGVSWALRGLGRKSVAMHAACVALSRTLAASEDRTARWIGKDALRELTNPRVVKLVKARAVKTAAKKKRVR